MQQSVERLPRVLMGQYPEEVNGLNMLRILGDVFLSDGQKEKMSCDFVQVMTGIDVVTQCLSSMQHRNLFDVVILTEYGMIDEMQIGEDNAARIIRLLDVYKKVPIIIVSRRRLFTNYNWAGITTWIYAGAGHGEFVAAIQASIQKMSGEVPIQNRGGNWNFITEDTCGLGQWNGH